LIEVIDMSEPPFRPCRACTMRGLSWRYCSNRGAAG